MKTNKQEREYHKIKKANRQMHHDNVPEDEAIKNIMLEKLRLALSKLSADDLVLIDLLFTQLKSEREIKETVPFTTETTRKYLGIHLT